MCIMLSLAVGSLEASARTLTHFYHRADQNEIKLTFKFDRPVQWRDTTPDPYHVAVDIDNSFNLLGYPERPMHIGPLNRIIFRETDGYLRIWLDLREPVRYDIYDEAGGVLLNIILHGPFAPVPAQETLFSFEFRDVDIRDVLVALAKAAGKNIVVDDSVRGTITLSFEGLTFDQALGYILQVRGLGMVTLAENIIVAERQQLEKNFGLLQSRRFPLRYIDPEAARQQLLLFFTADRVVADPATRSVYIQGREEDLRKAEEVLDEIDVALETRVFPLDNNLYQDPAQLEKITQLLQIIIPDPTRINYDFFQKTVLVRGTPEELEAAAELIKNLDRRLPQIMVDVKLVEIDRLKTRELGVTWLMGGQEGEITFGELSLGGTMERQDTIEMKISAMEKADLARLVGNPRVLTLSGNTARINVGDRVPYRQPIIRDDAIFYELRFLDVGISLEVTPSMTPEGQILVHAKPNVSTFTIREYLLGGLTYTDPEVTTKEADTIARLRNGESLVIGGLIRSEDREKITRIPILSEIPFLGELFILRNRIHRETELIIFLTPYLVEF